MDFAKSKEQNAVTICVSLKTMRTIKLFMARHDQLAYSTPRIIVQLRDQGKLHNKASCTFIRGTIKRGVL